jgi:hypothetical protein
MSEAAAGNAERFPLPSGGAPQCSQGTESPKGGTLKRLTEKLQDLGIPKFVAIKAPRTRAIRPGRSGRE